MLRDKIQALFDGGDLDGKDMEMAKSLLAEAEEMEVLHTFHGLTSKQQALTFRLLSKDRALSVFEELDTDAQQNLLRSFTDETTIELVNSMAPDDRVKLLDELPAIVAKKLINSLSPEEREVTNVLMGYQPETAGRIMTTEYISLKRDMTVEQALEKVSHQAEDKETVYTLFVTDSSKKLEGVLTLKGLLIARAGKTIGNTDGNTLVGDIMSKNAISVPTDTDQEEVANIMQELDLLAIPVVDREGRLVGIVTVDDAIDILEEEATDDILSHAGLSSFTGDDSRSDVLISGNMLRIWKVRLPFLIFAVVAAMLSGAVIGGFEDTLQSVIGIAVFIPLIMTMGGNVGTQSSTVFVRGVATGQLQIEKFVKHFFKETGIGISLGIVIGGISGVIAGVWQQSAMLGFVVGASLLITMAAAAILGFLVPFILVKLKIDQAAGSTPILTALKDIIGLVIYFVLVTTFLGDML